MALAVGHGRLVAMVTVGDDHRAGRHQRHDARQRRIVGDAPHAVVLAPEILRLGDQLTDRRGGVTELAIRVAHQHEQQTDVGGGRLQEAHPVFLRPGVRALVREHDAARVVADLAERDESRPRHGRAPDGVGLLIGIDGRPLVTAPHALGEPCLEHGGRLPVLFPSVPRIRHPDDVVRAHRVEALLRLRADLVVGRRDDRRHVGPRRAGVAVSVEGLDVHVSRRLVANAREV